MIPDFLPGNYKTFLIVLLFLLIILQRVLIKHLNERITKLTDILADVSRRTNNTTAKLMIIEARLNMDTLHAKEAEMIDLESKIDSEVESQDEYRS